ncbi:hypothetical protein BJV77DRAFT_97320 [Russula vinacea]|nr:hypothetical protein BJV77DRAFT_97320 [Russula vinacea]
MSRLLPTRSWLLRAISLAKQVANQATMTNPRWRQFSARWHPVCGARATYTMPLRPDAYVTSFPLSEFAYCIRTIHQ